MSDICGVSRSKFYCGCFSGVFLFSAILAAVLMADSLHKITEGNVGVYYTRGALQDQYTLPGVHWSVPFVTDIVEIKIRPQSVDLEPIKTVTRDGIENNFFNVQVLFNVKPTSVIPLLRKFGPMFRQTLIYDRIGEELRTFCANHTIDEVYNSMFLDIVNIVKQNVQDHILRLVDAKDGLNAIDILNLAIPKPDIPRDIAANYKAVKVQWTEQLVATQQQKTEKIKKETEKIKAILDAERQKDVLEINLEKDLLKKEKEKEVNDIENRIIKDREENQANVDSYKKEKQAEANKQLYSEQYIQLELAKSLSENTKFYFSGETSPLGGLLSKILGQGT